jgi:hypothetical protein
VRRVKTSINDILWGGGLRILKKRKNSYYFNGFGLAPDWGKITTILQTEYW